MVQTVCSVISCACSDFDDSQVVSTEEWLRSMSLEVPVDAQWMRVVDEVRVPWVNDVQHGEWLCSMSLERFLWLQRGCALWMGGLNKRHSAP